MTGIYIGTSGWNYKHWRNGVFYPKGLPPSQWLDFYSERFQTVELNNSFYRLPEAETFSAWHRQVPREFIFAVKASRFLTHIKRLKDPEEPLDRFFSHALRLHRSLGPVLFQLPPQLRYDADRFHTFLKALKAQIGRRRVRCVLEVRNTDWLVDSVYEMLHRYRVALCFADWRDVVVTAPVTGNFVYIRRHSGSAGRSNYSRSELNHDLQRIQRWRKSGLDVYVYFNNDRNGYAVRNAQYLTERL